MMLCTEDRDLEIVLLRLILTSLSAEAHSSSAVTGGLSAKSG